MNKAKIPIDLIMAKLTEDAIRVQRRVQKAPDVLLGPLDSVIAATPCDLE